MVEHTPDFLIPRAKHELRDYQINAVGVFERAIVAQQNCLIVAPTGSGKSNLCSSVAGLVLGFQGSAQIKFGRTLIVCPTRELVAQNANSIVSQIPNVGISIACAGYGMRDTSQPVIVGTPGTLVNLDLPAVDVLMIDEAHSVCSARKDSRINRIIAQVREKNPNALVFGVTATDYRLDSGRLSEHSGVWSRVDYEIKYIPLMRAGYLAPIIGPGSAIRQLDVSGVRRLGSRGDFIESDLNRAVNTTFLNDQIAREIIKHGADRKSWLIFAVGVEHCAALSRALVAQGANVDFIHGELRDVERDEKIARFKRGELRGLVNVQILTTGFDHSAVDLLAMVRPTASPGLMVQMIGRATRIAPNKTDALVLDFAGNFSRCGSFDSPIIIDKNAKQRTPAKTSKECPSCHYITSAAAKVCPRCDEEFPREDTEARLDKLRCTAENVEPLSGKSTAAQVAAQQNNQNNVFAVASISYAGHRSSKNPNNHPSLRITYRTKCGQYLSEYLCCWHDGQFGRSARADWTSRLKPDAGRVEPRDAFTAASLAPTVLRPAKFIRKITKSSGFTMASPVEFEPSAHSARGR